MCDRGFPWDWFIKNLNEEREKNRELGEAFIELQAKYKRLYGEGGDWYQRYCKSEKKANEQALKYDKLLLKIYEMKRLITEVKGIV